MRQQYCTWAYLILDSLTFINCQTNETDSEYLKYFRNYDYVVSNTINSELASKLQNHREITIFALV